MTDEFPDADPNDTTDALLLDREVDRYADSQADEHPDGVDDEEAERGLAAYREVDDQDDDDNGFGGAQLRGFTGIGLVAARMPSSPQIGFERARERARIVKRSLLAAGVPEVSIECLPGRPGTGDIWNMLDPIAVMSHHIASRPTPANPVPGLRLVKAGRPDLEGPLANGTAGVDLVYRIICLGMANHPGVGGPMTVRGPMGAYTIPEDVARPFVWGTEYEGGYDDATWDRKYTNKRTGKSMTFREFMGRANAGLVRGIWQINSHRRTPPASGFALAPYHMEHKSWAPERKVDRRGYTTRTGRDEVRKFSEKPKPPAKSKR